MSKVKSLKIKQADGTFSEAIALGANATNVDMANGKTLETTIEEIESSFDNYYDKDTVNTMLGDLSSLNILVVETLPATDISTSTIYLKPNTQSGTDNIYDEYIYVNNKWEIIGSTAVDLSNFYDKTTIDTKLADKATAADLTAHTSDTDIHVTADNKTTWNEKQDALVSGTNIKTINNESILGSGNIDLATEITEKEVAIQTTEPTDPDTKIWINPNEETTTETLAAVAFSGNYSDLNGLPDLSNLPSNVEQVEVIDNLTSTSATSALSANQGKVLDTRISAIESKNLVESSNITRIELVTEYPATQETGVLYIKQQS